MITDIWHAWKLSYFLIFFLNYFGGSQKIKLNLLKVGFLRESNGNFFSRSQSVWKYFFLKKHILKPLKKNPQVDWTRLSNFGEVQKVRFLSIFSKARKKSIFFRMFIKTQRKVLITLNSLYLTIFKCFTRKYELLY